MANYKLFDLKEEADTGWAHARAYATGNANASAKFHRGVDLAADVDVQAGAGSSFGRVIGASLNGGVRGTAGLNAQGALPIDIFDTAGVLFRLRGQAAAQAFVKAAIDLDLNTFKDSLLGQLKGAWIDLVDVFTGEIEIGAALWANYGVSVQFLAEAAILGGFHAIDGKPGFTCSFQYAMGYYYGGGFNVRTNFGIENPRRLVDRLSNQFVKIIDREIESALGQMTEAERTAIEVARPLVPLVLPLAMRTMYEVAGALITPSKDQQATTSGLVVGDFIREAQQLLLDRVIEFGVGKLTGLLQSASVADVLAAMTGPQAEQVVEILTKTRDSVVKLADMELGDEDWLLSLLTVVDNLAGLITFIPSLDPTEWKENLSLLWSAAIVINELLKWISNADGSNPSFNLSAPVNLPADGLITSHIAEQVKKSAGFGLTVGDAIQFLLSDAESLVAELRIWVPSSAPILDLLSTIIADNTTRSIFQILLEDFTSLEKTDVPSLLTKITTALGPLVENQLVPHLLTPLEQSLDPDTLEVVGQIIKPTLLSLTKVILPRVGSLGASEETARILREQISAVLLQSISRLMLVSSEILMGYAVEQGALAMRATAQTLRRGDGDLAVDAAIAALSLASGIPPEWTLTRWDAANLLDLCAKSLEFWNEHEREAWFENCRNLLSIGLLTGNVELDRLWRSIDEGDPNSPVAELIPAIHKFATRLAEGVWELIKLLAPDILKMVGEHFLNLGKLVVRVAEAAVVAAYEGLKEAAKWLDNQIDEMRKRIQTLIEDAWKALENIATNLGELAQHLRQVVNQAIDLVRDAGWTYVEAVLFQNSVFTTLPDNWEGSVKEGVRATYNFAFDAHRWLIDAPLQMFYQVTDWIREDLRFMTEAGSLDAEVMFQRLRARAQAITTPNMSLGIRYSFSIPVIGDVTIDLGSILFPGNIIVGILTDSLISNAALRNVVQLVVAEQKAAQAKTNEANLLQARVDQALTLGETTAAVNNLTTNATLQLSVAEPNEDSFYQGYAPLRVEVRGANRTFLTSTLGIPPRIKIVVNGTEHRYAPESWSDENGALVYRAKVVPQGVPVLPFQVLAPLKFIGVQIPNTVVLKSSTDDKGIPVLAVEPSPSPPVVIPVPSGGPTPIPFPSSGGLDISTVIEAMRQGRPTQIIDPLIQLPLPRPVGKETITPVVLQSTGRFFPAPDDLKGGVRWVHISDRPTLERVENPPETIFTDAGQNYVQVLLCDAKGEQSVVDQATFFLTKGG